MEQTRRLVESDEVALIFLLDRHRAITPRSRNICRARISRSLFIGLRRSKFADIAQYPQATIGVQAPFRYEARLYARYALAKNPSAKFAVISQNDDYGRDYLLGLKRRARREIRSGRHRERPMKSPDPTIDSQIVKLELPAPMCS